MVPAQTHWGRRQPWADALQMIGQRTPEVADQVVQKMGQHFAWVLGCRHSWTSKGSGGEEVWWPCTLAIEHQNRKHEIQASGHTVGSIGLPPSLTLSSRGRPCCLAALPPAKPTSALTPDATQERPHAPTAPEFKIPPHLSRVFFLERLRLPLPLTEKQCTACHEPLDHFWAPQSCVACH